MLTFVVEALTELTVRFRVATESQPAALTSVTGKLPAAL